MTTPATLLLCPSCLDCIGGACSGPDADYRPAIDGEPCGAADCLARRRAHSDAAERDDLPPLYDLATLANTAVSGSRRPHPTLTADSSRSTLIDWLETCDPNGTYSDADSMAEFDSVLTTDEAWDCIARMADDSRASCSGDCEPEDCNLPDCGLCFPSTDAAIRAKNLAAVGPHGQRYDADGFAIQTHDYELIRD